MDEHDWLAGRFEADRAGLRPLAYRLLGPAGGAGREDWTRLSRADRVGADELDGCLRTTVAQVTLHLLRSRTVAEPPGTGERAAALPGSARVALLVVFDTLTPPERLAYALQEMLAVPFEEIAALAARPTRQLAGSARRPAATAGGGAGPSAESGYEHGPYGNGAAPAAQPDAAPAAHTGSAAHTGTDPAARMSADPAARMGTDPAAHAGADSAAQTGGDSAAQSGADIAGAFLAASRGGDFEAMLTALDPNHPHDPDRRTLQPPNQPPNQPSNQPSNAATEPPPDDATPPPPTPRHTPATTAAQAGAHAERRGGDAVIGHTEIRGTDSVTRVCTVRTWAPVPALIDGTAGLVWVRNGDPQVAFRFTVQDGEITAAELETDLSDLTIVY
ncbi:hypothetical protein O7599_19060 [Streptomyces sp. WMMC500]|uniref:hypothetical protein n=1 Tax=Streptomyces sp. WMMC500 TaxID=3015154 RepID=UPI00248C6E47|nr:hypothetical protein [Streptomyces sp. WMMC500]WBB57786.1 hypothetical protein O7599_19060 [Streptomyces sp. WMMC500]